MLDSAPVILHPPVEADTVAMVTDELRLDEEDEEDPLSTDITLSEIGGKHKGDCLHMVTTTKLMHGGCDCSYC